jgi:hypothetical protein
LLLTMAVGTVCTCYAVSTCRFVTLEFQSQYGAFDEHFFANDPDSENLTTYQVGVGLFTWLRPFDSLEWSDGSCAGYNELQRDEIVTGTFEILRIVGIIAVIMSICLFLFSSIMTCLSLTRLQRYTMVACTFTLAAATGSLFLVSQSSICSDTGVNPSCTMDQGGLVALGGIVSWVFTTLLIMFCIKPVRDNKLTPKQKSQRKKELRMKQRDLLNQLEELELERRLSEKVARTRKVAPAEQGATSEKLRAPSEQSRTDSNIRNSSKAESRPETMVQSSNKDTLPTSGPPESLPLVTPADNDSPDAPVLKLMPVLTRIPNVLPRNKNQLSPTTGSRKHKQLESPKVSPIQSDSKWRISGTMDIYDVAALPSSPQEEVEAVYTRRARPIKKRRLRSRSRGAHATTSPVTKAKAKNAEKPRNPPGRYQGEIEILTPLAGNGILGVPPPLPVPTASPQSLLQVMETYRVARYPSVDLSTIITDQAVSQDIEVAISVDAINSLLDASCGDESNPDYRVEL